MITISENQLNQVEYLIQQSIQGNHVLFDTDTVREAFWNIHPSDDLSVAPVGPLIESLILEPTIDLKRAFLKKLDRRTFERVVRTYFSIVENQLGEHERVYH